MKGREVEFGAYQGALNPRPDTTWPTIALSVALAAGHAAVLLDEASGELRLRGRCIPDLLSN